jgi:hypothetical protein
MWVCRWMDKCVGNDQMKKRRHEILCSCVFASVNICHRRLCMCGNVFTVGGKKCLGFTVERVLSLTSNEFHYHVSYAVRTS